MRVEQGRNHIAGTIWHSEPVHNIGRFLQDHRNAAVRAASVAAIIGAMTFVIHKYDQQEAQIINPRAAIETQYTPQEVQPTLRSADYDQSLNMLLTSESIFDIEGVSLSQFARKHGYELQATPVYPVQRGEVASEEGLKTRRIPWENIDDDTTLMPENFWLQWGQTEAVYWQHEVTLTSHDGTRQKRWAARFINLSGKQGMWLFNAIEFTENGPTETFIRPPKAPIIP